MAGFDGSGNFFFTFSWVNDAQNGIPITASRMDTQFNDAVGGFDLCMTRDAQGVATATIPFPAGVNTDTINPYTALGPVLLSAGQLKFPATANPSSNANTLDDYQEASWVPADVSGSGLIFTAVSTGSTLIGNLMTIWGTITFPACPGDTNPIAIGGLPANCANYSGARIVSPWGGTGPQNVTFMSQNQNQFTVRDPALLLSIQNKDMSLKPAWFSITYPIS